VTVRPSGGEGHEWVTVSAKERNERRVVSSVLHQVPGERGVFRGRLRIPRWQTSGLWRVTRVEVVGFWGFYDVVGLRTCGGPGTSAARMRIRDTVSGVAEARLVVRHPVSAVRDQRPAPPHGRQSLAGHVGRCSARWIRASEGG
jgi:hypothetical protein